MALEAFSGAEESLYEVLVTGSVDLSTTYKRTGDRSFDLPRRASNHGGLSNSVSLLFTGLNELYFQGCIISNNEKTAEADENIFLAWRNSSTILGCLAVPNLLEYISVYVGDEVTGSKLVEMPVGVGSNWLILEGHILLDNSNGVIQIKANGNLLCDYTGNTMPGVDTTIDNMCFGNIIYTAAADYHTYWDDLIVCSPSGDYMNTWIGGAKIWCMTPAASGTYQEFTPMGEDTNVACVGQLPVSTEAYVESQVDGLKDTYILSTYPSSALSVAAVVARYWGAGEQQLKRIIRMNGSDYIGDTLTFPVTLGKVEEIIYLNLENNYIWRPTAFLDLESGMESVIV